MKGLTHTELDLIRKSIPVSVEVPLRRSDRVPHQSDRYYGFLIQDDDPIEFDKNDKDLITYMEAIQRSDSQKWLKIMKFEMESMKINSVWILIDPSKGIKSIRCK